MIHANAYPIQARLERESTLPNLLEMVFTHLSHLRLLGIPRNWVRSTTNNQSLWGCHRAESIQDLCSLVVNQWWQPSTMVPLLYENFVYLKRVWVCEREIKIQSNPICRSKTTNFFCIHLISQFNSWEY